MYFKDGDIFLGFARLVSFLRLEFDFHLLEVLSKYKHQNFFLELEQWKIK